jgi:kinesin family protein 6/9
MVPHDKRLGIVNNLKESHHFNFTHIFDTDDDQVTVFETLAKPVIQNCLAGYNGTIFAFGQTGSGKTYTMSGGDSWQERGIIPRVFSEIFREV